jgi:hypothetical protein
VAKYDKVIPPGQEGKIHMVIEGNKVHGTFRKSATVHSNDPEHPQMTIAIAANIIPYITVQPASRVYLQSGYGLEVRKTLTFKSNEEDLDFQITGIESNIDDKITYDFKENKSEDVWEVDIWKNPKLPTMSTFGSMIVHTNSEKSPSKTVQVQVITKGAITIQPQNLNFGRVKFGINGEPGIPVTKKVIILKSKGDFEIKGVSFSSDQFSAEIEAVELGKRYNISVTFQPPEKKQLRQTHRGEMTILTDDPIEPELKVRLSARSM